MYGNIYHPETGKWLASVENGKIRALGGIVYSLVEDRIVAADGTVLGYIGHFNAPTKGTGQLADQLFPSR
jgi:hypothetical protein